MGDVSALPDDIVKLLLKYDAAGLLLRLTCKFFFQYNNPRAENHKLPKNLLRNALIDLIIVNNNRIIIELFSYFKSKLCIGECHPFMEVAARIDNSEFIRNFILSFNQTDRNGVYNWLLSTWEIAGERGHTNIIDLIPSNSEILSYVGGNVMYGAAKSGNINVYKKYRKRFKINYREYYLAARNGYLDYLKMLLNTDTSKAFLKPDYIFGNGQDLFLEGAARGGYLEIIKLGISVGCQLIPTVSSMAAEGGHLDVLKWLRENNCPWDGSTISSAINRGDLKLLKWVINNNCPIDKLAYSNAALHGNLEILKWLKGIDYQASIDGVCHSAVLSGQLEIIKWARENDFPWNGYEYKTAAEMGNLKILKWLKENSCPWDNSIVRTARDYRHDHVIKWALKNKCPDSDD